MAHLELHCLGIDERRSRTCGTPCHVENAMKKQIGVIVICLFAACNQVEQVEPSGDIATEPELSSVESEVLQCSFGCASGAHPVGFSCNINCPGSCSAAFNQTDCRPNTGSSFFSCSLGCPPGYRPISLSFNEACRTSPVSSSNNNQTLCAL